VEHGERPEVFAAGGGEVEAGLDDVGERGEVGAAVRVDDALGLGGGAGGEGDRDHVVLVGDGAGLQGGPAVVAGAAIVVEAFEDGVVVGAAEGAFVGVCVLGVG